MGAGIALRYAIGHPERVCALVLSSFPRTGAEPDHREWAMGFADAIDRFGIEQAGEQFAWGGRARFDPKGAALIRQGFLEHPPHALAATLRNLLAVQPSPEDISAELAALNVPTLLIAGSEDAGALSSSRRLAERLPNAQLEVIEGAGHVVNLEAPTRFNEIVQRFLDAHTSGEVR